MCEDSPHSAAPTVNNTAQTMATVAAKRMEVDSQQAENAAGRATESAPKHLSKTFPFATEWFQKLAVIGRLVHQRHWETLADTFASISYRKYIA